MSKALIVGINNYPGNELKCCVNDATALANIIDTNTLMAGRYIKWQSYLYSILLTMSFAIIVDLSFIPYYRKISMTDSLKAIE